jgi:hypothetical protein
LAYYGGPVKWHELRTQAQASMDVYVFDDGGRTQAVGK